MTTLKISTACFLLSAVSLAVEPWLVPLTDVQVEHLKRPVEFFWREDPFLREPGRALASVREEALNLETILFDKERPIALINKIAVEKGDTIQGRRVLEIGKSHVVLEGEQSLLELVLAPHSSTVKAEGKNEK